MSILVTNSYNNRGIILDVPYKNEIHSVKFLNMSLWCKKLMEIRIGLKW